MSIINDALKKVQKNIEKNDPPAPILTPPTLGRDQDSPLPQPRINKSLLNTDTALPLTNPKPLPKAQPATTRPSSEPSVVKAALSLPGERRYQKIIIGLCSSICLILIFLIGYLFYIFGVSRPEEDRRSSPNRIVIQGIMARDDKNVALINNEIYEVGQTIQGRKIISISADSIQVSHRGKIKTLQVK